MSNHQRFTGRELTSLLEQVREELGAEATIVEANKVRTGGIAGFFTNERFEVIAAPSDEAIDLDHVADSSSGLQLDLVEPTITNGAAHDLVAAADERDTLDIRTTSAHRSAPATPAPARAAEMRSTSAPAAAAGSTARAHSPIVAGLLEKVDEIDTLDVARFDDTPEPIEARDIAEGRITLNDRIGLSRPAADRSTRPAPPAEIRFGDILSTELCQPDISVRTSETDDFWSHLDEIETEVESLDLESRIVVVVGSRSSALAVAHQNETADSGETRALVAISPDTTGVDLPAWQLVDNEIELGERLRFWQRTDRQGTVVIDADFGADTAALVERVRHAGSRVLRMAVDDELSPKRIFDLITRLGGNVVVDLAFRAEPNYVLSLADRGVPLASVDGHRFDANLLLALTREVQRG